tara:strand:+ start:2152 stop:2754 length:603 start_codon:yes stop_codon:yes gene_type:complete
MSIIKLNNRSVKDITSFGSISSLGSLTHIATQTASSSSYIDFTSGIDSTYKEYIFYFVNIHPNSSDDYFKFQGDTGTNTNYNQTITSTFFRTTHNEPDTFTDLAYRTGQDQAQGTSFQDLADGVDNDADGSLSGTLHLFNPSSTIFAKHFISTQQFMASDGSRQTFIGGYFNTTNAITRLRFKFNSGNIDSGQILLFGLN